MSAPGRLAHRPMGHLPALDGLRGIAIALVFMVHLYAPIFSGGSSGVDLFFVLSGFLITKLALEEFDRSGTLSRRGFYSRRVYRILPALFVLLAVLSVASFTLLSDVGSALRREILLSGISMGNLWPLFYGYAPRTALGHTWSLGLEEQFYLVWPVVVAFVFARRIDPMRWFRTVAAVTLASVVIGRVLVVGVLRYPHWEAIPLLNFDGIALGCLVAILVHHDRAGVTRRLPQWPAVIGAALVGADFFLARFYLDHDTYGLRPLVLRVAFAYIVIIVVTRLSEAGARRLAHPVLTWAGRWSYSIYLWHVPVFYALSAERNPNVPRAALVLLRVVVAIGAAGLSYRFIEQPALAWGRGRRDATRASETNDPERPSSERSASDSPPQEASWLRS